MSYGKTKVAAAIFALAASSMAFGVELDCNGAGVQVDIQSDEFEGVESFQLCARPINTEETRVTVGEGEDPKDVATFQGFFENNVVFGDDASTLILGDFSGNTDPFIVYSFGVTNSTAGTLTYTFTFLAPYVGGPYNTATSSHSSSITDGRNGAVTIGAPDASGFIHNPILDGVDVAGIALSSGCGAVGVIGFSAPCDVGSAASTGIASAVSGTFGVRLKFSVSARDAYSLNGRYEIENVRVPAPGVLALLGVGLLGLGALRRRPA